MPRAIGRYLLQERVGQGGMAEVYRATLSGIGGFERQVAVKLLRAQFAADTEFIEMLLDEARIAGGITHSNIVQILDIGREGESTFYLVMEYVDGTDLRGLMRVSPLGRVPLEHALFISMETAQGLAAVHATRQRIVHRDISPANVLLSRAGEVKLGDFGVARAESRLARTRVGNIKGKARYMAPEQLAGFRVDGRADLYALGVVLAESLVGPSIWDGVDEAASPHSLLVCALRAGVPEDVREVLRRALEGDAARRFPDAATFRAALAEPLYRRQPGYGEATLAAFLANPDGASTSEVTIARTEPEAASQPSLPATVHRETLAGPTRRERPGGAFFGLRLRGLRLLLALRQLGNRLGRGPRALAQQVGALGPRERALAALGGAAAVTVGVLAALIVLGGRTHIPATAAAAERPGALTMLEVRPAAAARARLPARPKVAAAPAAAPADASPRAPVESVGLETTATTPGRLAVYAPAGSRVRVAGIDRPAPALVELPSGRHRVEVLLPHGRRVARRVEIRADRTSELKLR